MGTTRARRLRRALEALVVQLELELPHHPMIYGTSDGSAIGGEAVAARPGRPRVPAHGTDWVPVVRASDDVSELPLHALVSQALVAFTIDCEDIGPSPMWLPAMLASTMPTGVADLERLPSILGITGTGTSFLERHGALRVKVKGRRRIAELTWLGRRARDAHQPVLDAIDALWRDRYGTGCVDELRHSLEEVDRRLDAGLPDHVLVRYKVGVGFEDVSLSLT
jgi:hypothetical protein